MRKLFDDIILLSGEKGTIVEVLGTDYVVDIETSSGTETKIVKEQDIK